MRRIFNLIVVLSITFIWLNTAHAADYQWNKLSMDTDTTVYISANFEQDHSLFSLADKIMYISVDDGKTWNKISTMPVWYVRPENDKNIYTLQGADQNSLSIYKFNPLVQGNWEKLCDAPSGTRLFTVLNNGIVIAVKPYESRSNWEALRLETPGLTWQSTGFNHAGDFLEATPDNLVFTMENGTNIVAKSSNYGITWKDISSSYKLNKLFVSPLYSSDSQLFAIINNSSINISYDRGESWSVRMTGIKGSGYLSCVAFSPNYKLDHTIYAADSEGQLFVSKDNSFKWKPLGVSLEDDNQLNSLIVLPDNKLLAGARKGVYELTTYIPPTQLARSVFVTGKATYTIGQEEWYMDTAPYVDSDRTFVPVRYLAYALGINDADILWDGARQEVTLIKDTTVVKISMGSHTLFVNDQPVTMDVLPQTSDERVFLPARWVAEAFGANVSWDGQNNSVSIEHQK